MKKLITLFLLVALVIITCFSNTTVYAKQQTHSNTHNIIALEDIPENVTPLYFDSVQEAEEYLSSIDQSVIEHNNKVNKEFQKIKNDLKPAVQNNTNTLMATTLSTYNYSTIVDHYGTFPSSPYEINLHCNYGTSGPHSGSILYCSASTTFDHITLFFTWSESSCNYYIAGKDIYCYANGNLTYYIIIKSIGNVYSWSINLSGYAHAID